MTKLLQREYAKLRRKGWHAKEAFRSARIRDRWHEAWMDGCVRLLVVPDATVRDLDDVYGDTFNPKANPDIQPSRMARDRKEAEETLERHGVVGLVGQYATNDEADEDDPDDSPNWTTADSCWGFVGNDAEDNGYDDDIRSATLDALEAQAIAANI